MKKVLDWHTQEVVNIFDEASIWAAMFGRLLLENIPMKSEAKVLDVGFGLGFPLIELSQRFGENSKIYGIDIWHEAIIRAKEKIRVLELSNIEIFEQSAEIIPLPDNELDLICSNLGVNNFENRETVLKECYRVLKTGGSICISTNPVGTFKELFDLYHELLKEKNMDDCLLDFRKIIDHRGTEESIISEFELSGFKYSKKSTDKTFIKFTNAKALFDHSLIRIGFLESWKTIIPSDKRNEFFDLLIKKIDGNILKNGNFIISIPMLYLEFKK
ncbi:MAG TPA: class I SAM-dependent methyltransferase [Ignavibacteria bacterium]|nr:class I SAM-dependent methyltransferase [Ignavibacteria bacterium]HQY51647.1 class I SAM-dependent methyltransferase [Ignavibacteria bacterium]HRA99119.1 class I SAM-dependent methyltransferase [Ignavibacteria bacterium]